MSVASSQWRPSVYVPLIPSLTPPPAPPPAHPPIRSLTHFTPRRSLTVRRVLKVRDPDSEIHTPAGREEDKRKQEWCAATSTLFWTSTWIFFIIFGPLHTYPRPVPPRTTRRVTLPSAHLLDADLCLQSDVAPGSRLQGSRAAARRACSREGCRFRSRKTHPDTNGRSIWAGPIRSAWKGNPQ